MDFDEFCREEHPRLVGSLSLYCGDPVLAEEFAQEALARACRDWGKVARMAAPGAWVHQVAMNLANSHFRRRAAARRARRRHRAGDRMVEPPQNAADAVAVRRAVAGLPEAQRRVLVLRFFCGLSVTEVAELDGRSQSAVTSLTHRAVENLRETLDPGDGPGREETNDVP